ncbi:putative Aldo-keto reductase yakc [Glarea lozoyensis 74030]|uniref:Putative Aldo-keto reductase yakc n=1 Tax=Glarea lozoyensis (strain ATCC 74030 / MF5533) TaxID=1104152 RepID=H0EL43_GLAL7|nr:putative Aldo-keto reductase yakc [Glarea lozoyensis 74030]
MTTTLPFSDIHIPVPGFGAMGLNSLMGTNLNLEQAEPVLQKAVDLGFASKYTPLEESITALDELRRAGKTKYIGLSECSAATLRKANSIAKIDAVQAEYSAFETLHERSGLIETSKELGIAFVAFSPLGHGWLVDDFAYKSPDDFALDDFRRSVPKFQGENFYKNKAIVDEIKKLATRKSCTVAQIALAWVAV